MVTPHSVGDRRSDDVTVEGSRRGGVERLGTSRASCMRALTRRRGELRARVQASWGRQPASECEGERARRLVLVAGRRFHRRIQRARPGLGQPRRLEHRVGRIGAGGCVDERGASVRRVRRSRLLAGGDRRGSGRVGVGGVGDASIRRVRIRGIGGRQRRGCGAGRKLGRASLGSWIGRRLGLARLRRGIALCRARLRSGGSGKLAGEERARLRHSGGPSFVERGRRDGDRIAEGRRGRDERRGQRGPRGQERQRIDVTLSIRRHANAEIHVRLRELDIAARPDRTDGIALEDGRAAVDADRPEMEERDGVAVLCLDRHGLATTRDRAREADRASSRREH
jgi:hypothetical protein